MNHFIFFLTQIISITYALIYIFALNAGCLYGDGYIKIFAGESTEDSALLEHVSAEFESILSIVSHHILAFKHIYSHNIIQLLTSCIVLIF